VEQPLDWLLRRGAEREAARAGLRRAEADSVVTTTQLLRDVRITFYRALAAAVSRDLVEGQARLADSVAMVSDARLRAGEISMLEQEQAALEAARARQAASTARETARIAQADLGRALGWEGQPPRAAGPLDQGVDHLPDLSVDAGSLPALRSAEADSASAAALARSAARARVPLPALTAGADWDDPTNPGALSVLGFALPLPLWSWNSGPLGEARARAAETAALAREARLDALQAVESARIRLEESAVRARFARDTLLPGAAALRRRAVRAYESGETDILPAIDALRSEREASLSAVQDQVAFQEAFAEWLALTGRDE
jgi:cobalt-zinc-cadmium efflux system outer membrane protein